MISKTASISIRMSNVDYPAYGVNAGMSGCPGRFVLNLGTPGEKILPSLQDGVTLETGDILQIAMPGGGYGHPFDREPERILRDVLASFVSSKSALEDYSFVLDVESEAVDLAATRDRCTAHRWPTKLFHRRRYFDAEEWLDSAAALRSSCPSRV